MLGFLDFLISLIDFLIPKEHKIVIFSGNGLRGLNGNSLAVIEGWQAGKKTRYFQAYVLSRKGENFSGFTTINPVTLKGLWILLRSYTVVITHGPGDLFWRSLCTAKKRRIIDLWHGMPMKMIGPWVWEDTAMIAASERERRILAEASKQNIKKVFVTGYPRTDVLINNSRELKKNAIKILSPRNKATKWVFYAPTHRKGIQSGGYLHRLPDFSLPDLLEILEKNNANLIFRYHINDKIEDFPRHSRIFPAQFNKFSEIEPLYCLADVLITDYSSAVFDYVLLDRPILGLASDLSEYTNQQGFLFDYQSSFPGPISKNWHELKENLTKALENPESGAGVRVKIRKDFNKFTDGHSVERVIGLICDLSVR